MAFVEKFKQESMYALSAQKKWPLLSGCRCGEVAVSGSSTVQSNRGKKEVAMFKTRMLRHPYTRCM